MNLFKGKKIKITELTTYYLKTEEYDDGVYIRYRHGRWDYQIDSSTHEVDCLEEISELETIFKKWFKKRFMKKYRK